MCIRDRIQRTKNIDFVYNSLTDESNSGEPSRFIKQLEYESRFNFNHKELQLPIKTELKREEVIVKSEKVQAVLNRYLSVSYTHLDVYKRQIYTLSFSI